METTLRFSGGVTSVKHQFDEAGDSVGGHLEVPLKSFEVEAVRTQKRVLAALGEAAVAIANDFGHVRGLAVFNLALDTSSEPHRYVPDIVSLVVTEFGGK